MAMVYRTPSVTRKIAWDSLICLIIIFTCIFIPLSLCFDVPNDNVWLTMDIAGDALFTLDIMWNF